MKLVVSMNHLTTALAEVTPVLNDALLQEEAKNVIFWVKDNIVKVVCNNLYTTCLADLECNLEFKEGESASEERFILVKAKELLNHLNCVSSLKMTKVDKIELDVSDTEIRLYIYEVPAIEDDPNADRLTQVSKYRLAKGKVVERIKVEIRNAVENASNTDAYINLNKTDMLVILDALIPAVKKETRDSVHTRVTFANDYVYVIPQTYAALMHNELPEGVSDFIVQNSVAQFMQSFFGIEEVTQFKKFTTNGDAVILVLKNTNATAVIKAMNASKAFNITNQKNIPESGFGISKGYFADVLKRIANTGEEIAFKVVLAEDSTQSTCTIMNKVMNQQIPVWVSKGVGEYSFMVKPDLLASITFSHLNDNATYLFFYLDKDETGKVTLCVTDDIMVASGAGHLWHTYTKGLAMS